MPLGVTMPLAELAVAALFIKPASISSRATSKQLVYLSYQERADAQQETDR